MADVLDSTIESLLQAGNARPEPPLDAMEAYGRDRDFPIVGPDVGRFLRVVATMIGAERVFEFGSGFGYSAAWIAGALPETGDMYLTDYDEKNLARAREFLAEAGYDGMATYRNGDALQSFDETSGQFDFVLIDHEKSRYADAFDHAVDRIADDGVVVADNTMAGPVEPAAVASALKGADPVDDATDGIATYIETVREHPSFESVLVPLGEGLLVSVRR
ncbi:MAG: O-methyltransferase [Halanaeroarchaeum sp.]